MVIMSEKQPNTLFSYFKQKVDHPVPETSGKSTNVNSDAEDDVPLAKLAKMLKRKRPHNVASENQPIEAKKSKLEHSAAVMEILTKDEIEMAEKALRKLTQNNTFDEAIKIGAQKLNDVVPAKKFCDEFQPGNYASIKMEQWDKIDRLLEAGENEMAVGYFAALVEYIGKDSKGSEKKTFTTNTSASRAYNHYVIPTTKFERKIVAEKQQGVHRMWLYKLFGNKPALYEFCETLMIDTVPMYRQKPLENEERGTSYNKTIKGGLDLRYSKEMCLFMFSELVTTSTKLSDANMKLPRPKPTSDKNNNNKQ